VTLPAFPSQGSTNWFPWAQAVHDAVSDLSTGASDEAVATLIADSTSGTTAALVEGFDRKTAIDARDYDALGFNEAYNAAFLSMIQAVKASRTHPQGDTGAHKHARRTIFIPAGDYRITELAGLVGREEMDTPSEGLRIKGAGSSLTQIIFDPATAGALIANDYWRNVIIEGVTFIPATDGCTFMSSDTTNFAQNYTFWDVSWEGPWKYVFDLQGSDNNSEYAFYSCQNHFTAADGAFLHIGATNTSDEFLNYWFFGFKHWSTSAPLIDAAYGGHFHIYGLDVSDWGEELAAPGYIFNLRGAQLKSGTKFLSVSGMRTEIKNALGGVLFSEWAHGAVDIQCDMSSQRTVYTYGDVIHLKFGTHEGPVYRFHDGAFAGGIKVEYDQQSSSISYGKHVLVEGCEWRQKRSPSEVVTYTPGSGVTRFAEPIVRFSRCRGDDRDAAGANGASVWDAILGHTSGDRVALVEKRELRVKTYNTTLHNGAEVTRVALPVGALITGLHVISPAVAGASVSATFTVATSEGTPTTVIAYTATRTQAQGYNLTSQLDTPYLCDTTAKATVTVTVTGPTSSQVSADALVILEGYW
jgi:hypothetical protein